MVVVKVGSPVLAKPIFNMFTSTNFSAFGSLLVVPIMKYCLKTSSACINVSIHLIQRWVVTSFVAFMIIFEKLLTVHLYLPW